MEAMLSFYQKLTHIGVHADLSYLESRRTQMLNLIALTCVPLTFFFSVTNFNSGHHLLSMINLANSAASASVLWLHHKNRYQAGRLVLLAFNFILFSAGCFLYQNGAAYYLLCVLIVTILVYDRRWVQIIAGIAIITVILFVTFYPRTVPPEDSLPISRNIMNTVGALGFMAFIISFFKHIQYGYQAKIEEQHDKLKEMNVDMQKLFSIVSHDIKSPLASLQSVILLFQEGLLSPETTEQSIRMVNRRISQLNDTLENLLHWSSKNLQGLQTTRSHIYLAGAVQETCYFLESLAYQKAIDFNIQIDADAFVYADRDQLSTILRNLLSNAIKFSYSGGTVTIIGRADDGNMVLDVVDQGTGMDHSNVEQLFLSLQNPSFGTDGERGSGVGLLLCHELIKQNEGGITVHSVQGEGSTFRMTLPLGKSQKRTVFASQLAGPEVYAPKS